MHELVIAAIGWAFASPIVGVIIGKAIKLADDLQETSELG